MNTTDLQVGKKYYYTLPVEWVEVTYLHETINGYKFGTDEIESILSKSDVEKYIAEI